MADAFALPFREFQSLRVWVSDKRADDAYWSLPEGIELLLYRDALDLMFWEIRASVGELLEG